MEAEREAGRRPRPTPWGRERTEEVLHAGPEEGVEDAQELDGGALHPRVGAREALLAHLDEPLDVEGAHRELGDGLGDPDKRALGHLGVLVGGDVAPELGDDEARAGGLAEPREQLRRGAPAVRVGSRGREQGRKGRRQPGPWVGRPGGGGGAARRGRALELRVSELVRGPPDAQRRLALPDPDVRARELQHHVEGLGEHLEVLLIPAGLVAELADDALGAAGEVLLEAREGGGHGGDSGEALLPAGAGGLCVWGG